MLAVDQFRAYLDETEPGIGPLGVERRHVEGFITRVLDTRSSATAKQRYQSLNGFFKWLAEEEGVDSPMVRIRPPKVDEKPPPVMTRDQLSAIVATTTGKSFDDRRDRAILLILIDTGIRASELTGLTSADVSLEPAAIYVRGKGDKYRSAPLGHEAVLALDRYERARSRHPHAHRTDALFLGARGPLTRSGLGQLVGRRGKQAGMDGVFPHLFRHSFVHHWLATGGQEGDVARILGWSRKSSAQLLERYGASAATERAHAAHQTYGLGDRL